MNTFQPYDFQYFIKKIKKERKKTTRFGTTQSGNDYVSKWLYPPWSVWLTWMERCPMPIQFPGRTYT